MYPCDTSMLLLAALYTLCMHERLADPHVQQTTLVKRSFACPLILFNSDMQSNTFQVPRLFCEAENQMLSSVYT